MPYNVDLILNHKVDLLLCVWMRGTFPECDLTLRSGYLLQKDDSLFSWFLSVKPLAWYGLSLWGREFLHQTKNLNQADGSDNISNSFMHFYGAKKSVWS